MTTKPRFAKDGELLHPAFHDLEDERERERAWFAPGGPQDTHDKAAGATSIDTTLDALAADCYCMELVSPNHEETCHHCQAAGRLMEQAERDAYARHNCGPIADDGYLDGGEQYTPDELAIINGTNLDDIPF